MEEPVERRDVSRAPASDAKGFYIPAFEACEGVEAAAAAGAAAAAVEVPLGAFWWVCVG